MFKWIKKPKSNKITTLKSLPPPPPQSYVSTTTIHTTTIRQGYNPNILIKDIKGNEIKNGYLVKIVANPWSDVYIGKKAVVTDIQSEYPYIIAKIIPECSGITLSANSVVVISTIEEKQKITIKLPKNGGNI